MEDVSPLSSIDVYNAKFEENVAFTRMINCRPNILNVHEIKRT